MSRQNCLLITCRSLLTNDLDDGCIEISYNSAGVLAQLCDDGPDAWQGDVVDDEETAALDDDDFVDVSWATVQKAIIDVSSAPALAFSGDNHLAAERASLHQLSIVRADTAPGEHEPSIAGQLPLGRVGTGESDVEASGRRYGM